MQHLARAKPILELIKKYESRNDYNVVWGKIRAKHRPPDLQSMTVGKVLEWQDTIDPLYMSEAAGAYQILEDTLRGLYRQAGVSLNDKFDQHTQDKLGYQLLVRRGFEDFLSGKISKAQFGNSLAKEWASLPVLTNGRGSTRYVNRGQTYYAGDGLNMAHAKPEEVEAALTAALLVTPRELDMNKPSNPDIDPTPGVVNPVTTTVVLAVAILVGLALLYIL